VLPHFRGTGLILRLEHRFLTRPIGSDSIHIHHSVSSRCLKIPFIFGFRRRLRQRGFLREQSFRPRPKSSVPSLNIQPHVYDGRGKKVHPPVVLRWASLLTLPGTGAVVSP